MIEVTRKHWCDGCGREITGYSSGNTVIEIDDDGYAKAVGREFCEECAMSFQNWLKERRATNPEKSYIDQFR